MSYDLIVRGGRVVDGTGLPGFVGDVGVRDGRIVAIGRLTGGARRVIDADGCWVTPGFIDVHTHYDVQLEWDPTASPASWHGVTTVLCGNCGFTLAPARPADCEWLAQMLSRVEGMSPAALAAGLTWRGGGFGDFWQRLEGRLGVNAGAYVGHSAVRRFVMGDAASERRATPEEVAAMQALVRAGMREGALGFSSSQLDIHIAHDGREVPSNHAAPEEVLALAGVLAEFGRGAVEFIPRSFAEGYNAADRDLLLGLHRVSGRPVELNVLTPLPGSPEGWTKSLEFVREAVRGGARLHPQFASHELGAHFALDSTFLFDEVPTFRAALTQPEPERSRRLADPAVRDRLRAELADPTGRAVFFVWEVVVVEEVRDPRHAGYVGRTVAEIAQTEGKDPLDFLLDLSLAEELTTQFALINPARDFTRGITEACIREPFVMAGSSDGGAHLLSFVGADYTTRLLAEWVPDVLSLEAAVARLTAQPAVVHGIRDRGMIREGLAADLLVIDPARLGVGATRRVADFPGGASRYVVDAAGYVASVVNGAVLLEDGVHTGACPGQMIRGE